MDKLKGWSAEKMSRRVFYLLIGVAVVVFALFFLVGYDMPFEENPDFNAPLFTNVLIILMCLLLLLAFALAVGSFVVSSRKMGKQQDSATKEVPEKKISRVVWLGTVLLLVLTFAVGSSTPIVVNGKEFASWSWLKLSDMLVYTSVVLLLGALGAVIFGATRYIRKEKK